MWDNNYHYRLWSFASNEQSELYAMGNAAILCDVVRWGESNDRVLQNSCLGSMIYIKALIHLAEAETGLTRFCDVIGLRIRFWFR